MISTLRHPEQWPAVVNNFAELYDKEFTLILDWLIPALSVVRRKRASDVWFDSDCRQAKRASRRHERVYAQDVSIIVLCRRQRMIQQLV
jgi:hypothetical protein